MGATIGSKVAITNSTVTSMEGSSSGATYYVLGGGGACELDISDNTFNLGSWLMFNVAATGKIYDNTFNGQVGMSGRIVNSTLLNGLEITGNDFDESLYGTCFVIGGDYTISNNTFEALGDDLAISIWNSPSAAGKAAITDNTFTLGEEAYGIRFYCNPSWGANGGDASYVTIERNKFIGDCVYQIRNNDGWTGTVNASHNYFGGTSIKNAYGEDDTSIGSVVAEPYYTDEAMSTLNTDPPAYILPNADGDGNHSTIEEAIQDAIASAGDDTAPEVKVEVTENNQTDTMSKVSIPTKVVTAVQSATMGESDTTSANASLSIKSDVATVTFNNAALTNIVSNADEAVAVELTVEIVAAPSGVTVADNAIVLDINLIAGETSLGSSFAGTNDGTATITVAAPEGANRVYYIADDGNKTEVADAVFADGYVTFTVSHFSFYSVEAVAEAPVCNGDETCPAYGYTDLNLSLWYHDGIHYCVENGLMFGYPGNLFGPNDTATRGQIVTILYRLEGEPSVQNECLFGDVADGSYYEDAITWAADSGIVFGYGENFGPDDAITREQMATILYRYAKYKGYDVSVGENTNFLSYSDAIDVAEYAIPAMQWACGAGIIQGDNNALMPQGSALRCQAAAILQRFCEKIVR